MTERLRSFAEFERCAKHFVEFSTDSFKSRFAELSNKGDRNGMIKSFLDPLDTSSISVKDNYCGKNSTQAAQLLRHFHNNNTFDNFKKSPIILSGALSCAEYRSELFFEILWQRARAWARVGEVRKCATDCRFFIDSLAKIEDQDFALEMKIGILVLHSEACEKLGSDGECEAIKLRNEAKRLCDELSGIDECNKDRFFMSFCNIEGLWPLSCSPANLVQICIPAVEGKVNKFLRNCSDAVALGNDKTKGRLLYATRNIKAGSVLIVDQPFSFCTDQKALRRNCLNCHISLKLPSITPIPCESCRTVQFCSEECCQQAWIKFHKYECRILNYFYENELQKTNSLLAYRTVVTAALRVQGNMLEINPEFLKLHENDSNILDDKSLGKYESQDYKTVFNLETHCSHSDPKDNLERVIQSIYLAKCLLYVLNYFHSVNETEKLLHILAVALMHNMQAINCNAYEIVENVYDQEKRIFEPRNVGGAIYTSVSLTNHSCYPNIVRHSYPCGTVVVRSLRFIPQGAEILDCYGQHFLENNRDFRRKLLAQKYYFTCQCEACLSDWPIKPIDEFNFKCKKCFKLCRKTKNAVECTACGQKTEISKLNSLLNNSIKKRLISIQKMHDYRNYQDALPLLLEHENYIDKILSEPSLETVKTQQSIIQCLNAMSSTST